MVSDILAGDGKLVNLFLRCSRVRVYFNELESPNGSNIQYFGKRFFINRSYNFIVLLNFYARHLGVKITGP
jgi:hypothetical protein